MRRQGDGGASVGVEIFGDLGAAYVDAAGAVDAIIKVPTKGVGERGYERPIVVFIGMPTPLESGST